MKPRARLPVGAIAPQDSQTDTVGLFPPVCEELMAIPSQHGAVLVAARNITVKQIATFISFARTTGSAGRGANGA